MKILIVYYSKSGITKKTADKLAKVLNADVKEIESRVKFDGLWGFVRGGFCALNQKETEIKEMNIDFPQYELVLAGSPVWAGNIAPPVRTFVKKYKDSIKNAAYFLTNDSGDFSKTIKNINETLTKDCLCMTLSKKERMEGKTEEIIDNFKNKLMSS